MLACDFDLKFVHVHAGWEGSASDARVLHDALNHGFEVPPGKFFLVDAGYANTTQFLEPYRGTAAWARDKAGAAASGAMAALPLGPRASGCRAVT